MSLQYFEISFLFYISSPLYFSLELTYLTSVNYSLSIYRLQRKNIIIVAIVLKDTFLWYPQLPPAWSSLIKFIAGLLLDYFFKWTMYNLYCYPQGLMAPLVSLPLGLTYLGLSGCRLKEEEIVALASSKHCSTLLQLDISENSARGKPSLYTAFIQLFQALSTVSFYGY